MLIMCPGVTDTPLVKNVKNKVCDFVEASEVQKLLDNLPLQP